MPQSVESVACRPSCAKVGTIYASVCVKTGVSRQQVRTFEVGMWLDVRCKRTQSWYPAKVNVIEPKRIRVHFYRWPKKYDEWVSTVSLDFTRGGVCANESCCTGHFWSGHMALVARRPIVMRVFTERFIVFSNTARHLALELFGLIQVCPQAMLSCTLMCRHGDAYHGHYWVLCRGNRPGR